MTSAVFVVAPGVVSGTFVAPAVTEVRLRELAMESASIQTFTSSFAH